MFTLHAKLIHIITTFLWSTLSFDSLIATLFFLAIIAILLSCFSYFNLVFSLIFTYSSRETIMEIMTFRGFCLCHLRSSCILVKICSKAFYIRNNYFLSLRLFTTLDIYIYIFCSMASEILNTHIQLLDLKLIADAFVLLCHSLH